MICGFDIGGTKVLGIAVGDDPVRPEAVRRAPTIVDGDQLVAIVSKMVEDLEADTGQGADAVGVGIAGLVDRNGFLHYSPNLPGLVDFDFRGQLEAVLTRPVLVDNDATTATWAEALFGAGRGRDHVLFVALGTGIGTGFVFDGRIHRGWQGFAGESGHMVVDRHGPRHITGALGPWEMYASGNGLGLLAREAAVAGQLSSVLEAAGSVDAIRGEQVHAAVDANDPEALALLDVFADHVGIGLANLIHILDPEIVIIGGGLVEFGPQLLDRLSKATHGHLLGAEFRPVVKVVAATLGSRAGAIGAAILARELVADG